MAKAQLCVERHTLWIGRVFVDLGGDPFFAQFAPGRCFAPFATSASTNRKGTTSASPTAASSAFVNAATSLPFTRGSPLESTMGTSPDGP